MKEGIVCCVVGDCAVGFCELKTSNFADVSLTDKF
jgi:hypothetical protein